MQILIQFENTLEYFLSNIQQNGRIEYVLKRRASVKDIIESFGVPHTEVGEIRFNNKAVDFRFVPDSSGQLEVLSIPAPFDVRVSSRLRPDTYDKIQFIADVNVIKLGRMMILLGFDVLFSPAFDDQTIAKISVAQERIVLTRDTRLLMRKKIIYGRRIREDRPYSQLVEVLRFFGLSDQCRPLSRCTQCNRTLERVEKENVLHLLEPKTKKYFHSFFQCPVCKKVYWKGSHHDNLIEIFKKLGLPING